MLLEEGNFKEQFAQVNLLYSVVEHYGENDGKPAVKSRLVRHIFNKCSYYYYNHYYFNCSSGWLKSLKSLIILLATVSMSYSPLYIIIVNNLIIIE